MDLWGYFCSLNCAKRHALDLPHEKKRADVISLFNLMTMRNFGRQHVVAAPGRHHLKMYGGKLTLEKFRDATFLQCDSTKKGGRRQEGKLSGKQKGEVLAKKGAVSQKPKFRLRRALKAFGMEEYLPGVHG